MTTLFVIGIALVALAWVLAAARRGGVLMESAPSDDALVERKAAALSALTDLDDELAAGKITADDHAALRASYETAAIGVLHEIDDAADR